MVFTTMRCDYLGKLVAFKAALRACLPWCWRRADFVCELPSEVSRVCTLLFAQDMQAQLDR